MGAKLDGRKEQSHFRQNNLYQAKLLSAAEGQLWNLLLCASTTLSNISPIWVGGVVGVGWGGVGWGGVGWTRKHYRLKNSQSCPASA